MKYATVILLIAGLAVAEPASADPWAGGEATIRDESFYKASTGLKLGGATTLWGGVSGYEITEAFQINLDYQAGILNSNIANFNTYSYPANVNFPPGHYDGAWDLNFDDEEYYVFSINPAETGLTVYTYDPSHANGFGPEVFDADIDWTVTGWHQTILAGYIDGNRLVVDPNSKYRPFDGDMPVNDVEIFSGLVDTEVIAYTFGGNANDIGSGDTLGVQTVPVPGAVLLGAMGLGMVGWMKRRKKEA